MDPRRQAVVSNLKQCLAESLEALGRGAETDLVAGLAKRLEAMAFELCIPGVDDAGYEDLNEGGLVFTCWAAKHGHADCLRAVLQELSAGTPFSEDEYSGGDYDSAASTAAAYGQEGCLRVLGELGVRETLINGSPGEAFPPAFRAAENGHANCLRALHELGATLAERSVGGGGLFPAHEAAEKGQTECLAVLHELGAGATLSAPDKENGETPALKAARAGQEESLRALHKLGAGASFATMDSRGRAPAHYAGGDCLRVLAELGAAASFCAVGYGLPPDWLLGTFELNDTLYDRTPAHEADDQCMRILHEELTSTLEPQITMLQTLGEASNFAIPLAQELSSHKTLSWTSHEAPFDQVHFSSTHGQWTVASPAVFVAMTLAKTTETHHGLTESLAIGQAAFDASGPVFGCASPYESVSSHSRMLERQVQEHRSTYTFLSKIGGAKAFEAELRRNLDLINRTFSCLLAEPGLLEFETKQEWLVHSLAAKANEVQDGELVIVVDRSNLLGGACQLLGVQEASGHVDAQARGLQVQFDGESAEGDGLRREWLGAATSELLDQQYGLFVSKDGGRTIQPNPHSETTHGPDHLSYFALLGRFAGLALHHRELLPLPLTEACVKVVLGHDVTFDDLKSVDPELHEQLNGLRAVPAEDLSNLSLTFTVDGDEAIVYDDATKRRQCAIELMAGGEHTDVCVSNLENYLLLVARHHLIGSIAPQLHAIRGGLDVFVDRELRAALRRCCTPAEFQLMLCGVGDIDVDDWQGSSEYQGYRRDSEQVLWFWAEVRGMSSKERGKLLHFCTGSVRAPAMGFAALAGYSGQQQRFRIALDERGDNLLPTAATCFNTIKLPRYPSAAVLRDKLRLALSGNAAGFHEGAVAE